MGDEEKQLVTKPDAAGSGAQTAVEAPGSHGAAAGGQGDAPPASTTDLRRPSLKDKEILVDLIMTIIGKTLGNRFKEKRNLVVFAAICVGLCGYVLISTKYLIEALRSGSETVEDVPPSKPQERFSYPPGCDETICLPENTLKNFTVPPVEYAGTGLMKTLMFLKNCSSEKDRSKHHIGHLKRALYEAGLPSSPYEKGRLDDLPDVAGVLGKVMLMLNLKIFFTIDFETAVPNTPANSVGKIVSIRKLPLSRAIGERQRDAAGKEKSEFMYNMLKTRHFIPPSSKLYDFIGHDFYNLAESVSEEFIKATNAEDLRIIPMNKLPEYPKPPPASGSAPKSFDWVLFFNTLLPQSKPYFTGKTLVALHDEEHIKRVMKLIVNTDTYNILNYILLFVWSYYVPLLPSLYTSQMRYLPFTDYSSITVNDNFQACIKLAEAFCPKGMIAVIRHIIMGHKDKEEYKKWVTPLAEGYRNMLLEFFKNGLSELIGKNLVTQLKVADHLTGSISLAIPNVIVDYDVAQLDCDSQVDPAKANLTLYYFREAVSESNRKQWRDKFYTTNVIYTPPVESNFVFDVSFEGKDVFIPLTYLLNMIKYPDMKTVFLWMSLPDVLRSLVRELYRMPVIAGTQVKYGEAVGAATHNLGTCVLTLFARYLNMTKLYAGDQEWFLGDALVYKWMMNFTMQALVRVDKAYLTRGFPESEKRKVPYYLMAESACRKYYEATPVWDSMLYYNMPPRALVNVALMDYEDFADTFGCKPGDPMVARQTCSLTDRNKRDPIDIHRIIRFEF
ncbi:uncharacterized protein LOC135397743 isoform X2 [Ornithodoros turicata]|uniref:uncharacterized protein LOC135397743 isoform X2 n=1 Tax=Ornithodoros turicata TaxID=34597 RepID=UPI003139FE6B